MKLQKMWTGFEHDADGFFSGANMLLGESNRILTDHVLHELGDLPN